MTCVDEKERREISAFFGVKDCCLVVNAGFWLLVDGCWLRVDFEDEFPWSTERFL